MKSSFWKALETLGATGSAACNWHQHLGPDWKSCRPFLKPTGRTGRNVIDPRHPQRTLSLVVDGEEDFVAVDDDPSLPPIPYTAAEVAELRPDWSHITRALAQIIGFDPGAWETAGPLRRIGSSQDPFGRVSPVLLFLPPGQLGDYPALFRELVARTEATVLIPTQRWLTTEIEALRTRNHLEFIDLADRLRRLNAHPTDHAPLPVVARPAGPARRNTRAIIHAGNGLTWSQITIEIQGNQTIRLTAPGQEGSHTFPKRQQLAPEHPLGILMTLAAKGEWRNPPGSAPDYDRISKAFQRLQALLRSLVPLPGKPFKKSAGASIPIFQIRIHPKLCGSNPESSQKPRHYRLT